MSRTSTAPGRRSGRRRHRREPIRQALHLAGRRVVARSLRVGAFAFVALLLLGAMMPMAGTQLAEARTVEPSLEAATEPQALVMEDQHPEAPSSRDDYTVMTRAELLRQQYTLTYTTNWTGAIRWPFPVPVRISDGYGYRPAPCSGCSTYHTALDFDAGYGSPIYAIADGVVVAHDDGWDAWGNYVIIEHQINGQTVRSSNAHMQRGSSPLVVGQTINVGDYVGLVGGTGQVSGPHLHFEIEIGGQTLDPYEWLTANAG